MPSNLEKIMSAASGNEDQILLFTSGGENPTKPWEEQESETRNGHDHQTIGKISLTETVVEPVVD